MKGEMETENLPHCKPQEVLTRYFRLDPRPVLFRLRWKALRRILPVVSLPVLGRWKS